MADLIQEVVGPSVKLINSAEEITAEVKAILKSNDMANPLVTEKSRHRYFVSGNPGPFEEVGSTLLERDVKAYQVQL